MSDKEELKGKFVESLVRSNKDIKKDRAVSIAEDASIRFRRVVEDIALDIKRKRRDLHNMLDLSPANSFNLIVAENFDSAAFTEKQIDLLVAIRNLEIKFTLANDQLFELFGETVEL